MPNTALRHVHVERNPCATVSGGVGIVPAIFNTIIGAINSSCVVHGSVRARDPAATKQLFNRLELFMTPQETALVTTLLERLKKIESPDK
jgi:hypothetical protein